MTMPYLCYLHLGFWKYVKIKDHPLIKDERRCFLQTISSDIILTPYESRDCFIVHRSNTRRIA